MSPLFSLGSKSTIDGRTDLGVYRLPAHHLVTHGVVVGMTGSGKTGLLTVLVEEALRAEIPVLLIDVKGDLPNLTLAFPSLDPTPMTPWIEPAPGDADGIADAPLVIKAAETRRRELALAGVGERELAEYVARTLIRVVTPGIDAGEALHLLSPLERRSARWDHDIDGARATLAAAVSTALRLVGHEGDPGKSREHAFLTTLAEARLVRGENAPLETLLAEILDPPVAYVGALPVDSFLSARQRHALAADLNTLIASSSFASWRRGQDLDVAKWMEKVDGRTPATIVSVAHLDDTERELVLGMILEETLTWVRGLSGSSQLRALIVFDEVYGFIPPHPENPPTKRPLVALMKQARAFGVGCVVATQNPMDLDYRALSNAGTWMLGRLQTDADRARVMDGLGEDKKKGALASLVKRISPRWFVVRDARDNALSLLRPRWAMSLLRGPMTPNEIRRRREEEPGIPADESSRRTSAQESLGSSSNGSGRPSDGSPFDVASKVG